MINKVYQRLRCLAVFAIFTAIPFATMAQSGNIHSRYPETGMAILDCDPGKPAPQESCTLRLPLGQLREQLRKSDVGAPSGEFEFIQPENPLFPSNLTLSATVLLIDLTPGPNGGRNRTFAFEKTLLESFAKGLPENESIAIYGFNESLELIVDFTNDHGQIIDAIKAINLRGANTRIATHTKAVIKILDKKKDVLFKNLVVISDGEEEGIGDPDEITKLAIDVKVSISAVGMFWRTVGSAQTGAGMDYLDNLTEGGLGSVVSVPLRNNQQSRQNLDKFVQALKSSWDNSGLIVPLDVPKSADITVTMKVPVPGEAGNFRTKEISARFVPQSDPSDTQGETPDENEGMFFGYPKLWVYIGAGALLSVFLLLLILLIRRKSDDQDDDTDELDELDSDDVKTSITNSGAVQKAHVTPAAHAYLVYSDTNKRIPLSGQRISIGRSSSNLIKLQDDSISRVHAELHRNRNGGYSVTDMNSLNGTFVNDTRITGTQSIRAGDMLKFGEIEIKLVLA